MKNRIKKIHLFLIPGILGFILFFPWRFQNGHTCIADQILKWNTQAGQIQLGFEKQRNRYVLPFGLFWWASAGMMAVALFMTKPINKKEVKKMEGLKKQKIVLAKNVHNGFDNLANHLKSSTGVVSVRYESSSHSIRVQYQLKKITLKEIEEKIIKFGAELRMGFWHRLVRATKHYMEINERENLTAKPLPCCSKPDAILSKH